MAEVQFDRVQEATAITGAGDVPLGGATPGFVSFASVMAGGDTSRFVIYDDTAKAWEVFAGVYNSTANTLSRTTVEASSNNGKLVNFAGNAGTYVFMDASATFIRSLAPKLNPTFIQSISVQGYAACITTGNGQISMNPGDATHTGYVGFFDKSGVRQGFIGFGNGTLSINAEAQNTGWSMQGTLYVSGLATVNGALNASSDVNVSGFLTGRGGATILNNLTVLDQTTSGNNLTALQINAAGNPAGANIKLVGAGTTTPSKYLRTTGGLFQVINDGYSAVIMNLDDNGNWYAAGSVTAQSGGSQFKDNLTINDSNTTGNIANGLTINSPNNGQGANLTLRGQGTVTPKKVMRAWAGQWQIVNDAYNAVLLGLDDGGNLTIAGRFDQLTAETNRAVAAENSKVGKNLLHNGRLNINQRGANNVGSGAYPIDRWRAGADGGSTVSIGRGNANDGDRSGVGDESMVSYIAFQFTGGTAAGTYCTFTQAIEYVRTAAGKPITLSFTARADRAGLFMTADFEQEFGTGGSPSPETAAFPSTKFALTTNWQRFTCTGTVASLSGKTLGTNGDDSLTLFLWAASNSQYATRAQNLGAQTGTIYLTQIKVEIGTVATPMPPLDPMQELNECLRFFRFVPQWIVAGFGNAGNGIYSELPLNPPMRTAPGVTIGNISYNNASGYATNATYTNHIRLQVNSSSNAGSCYGIGDITISADL